MCDCNCHQNYNLDTLVPMVGIVTDIRQETPDVKTFRVNAPEGGKLFEHKPGQCAMVSVPGVGEAMFSITSSPTNKEYQEFSIKKCGVLTDYLHELQVGDEITTIGGIIGRIVSIKDETCVLETTKNGTKIRILKTAVRNVDVRAEDAQ